MQFILNLSKFASLVHSRRIREVIPVPDSLWKETTFVRFLLAEGIWLYPLDLCIAI